MTEFVKETWVESNVITPENAADRLKGCLELLFQGKIDDIKSTVRFMMEEVGITEHHDLQPAKMVGKKGSKKIET